MDCTSRRRDVYAAFHADAIQQLNARVLLISKWKSFSVLNLTFETDLVSVHDFYIHIFLHFISANGWFFINIFFVYE